MEQNLVFAKIIIRARNAKIIDILQPLFCIHDLICIWLIFPLSSLLTSFSRFTIFTHWLKTSLHERKRLSFYLRGGFNINAKSMVCQKGGGCGDPKMWAKMNQKQRFSRRLWHNTILFRDCVIEPLWICWMYFFYFVFFTNVYWPNTFPPNGRKLEGWLFT